MPISSVEGVLRGLKRKNCPFLITIDLFLNNSNIFLTNKNQAHDFPSHFVKKTGYYSPTINSLMREVAGRGGISTKSVLGSQKTIETIFSHAKYFFSIFFPNIKIIYSAWYWPKSLQFGKSAQFGRKLDIHVYMSGNELEWKFIVCPNLEERVLKGSKMQKLYDISKNQPPMSITRGGWYKVSPFF